MPYTLLALLAWLPAIRAQAPVWGYEVVHAYPHDRHAFTQGLAFADGRLYEGTGLRGQSTLREVEPETGRVRQLVRLAARYFGEGIAVVGARVYQLTWRAGTGFVYERDALRPVGRFSYRGEGWGLAWDGARLVLSDGSDTLRFLDPHTLDELGRVRVHDGQRPVAELNELEFVRGEIWANVWQTDRIARIDPDSGRVTGWIDLAGLLPEADATGDEDVLNGIAWDAQGERLFVTGKRWPRLFEIRLRPPGS